MFPRHTSLLIHHPTQSARLYVVLELLAAAALLTFTPGCHHCSRRSHSKISRDCLLGCNAVSIALAAEYQLVSLTRLSSWSFYVPLIGTLVNLGLLYWKRLDTPINYVLLSTFTLLEAFTLGISTAFFDNEIVLQAL